VIEFRFFVMMLQMDKSLRNYFFLPSFTLRPVKDGDVDVLVPIINEAYSYQDSAKGEPRTNPSHLRKRISETEFFVIENQQNVIGCVYLEPKERALHFGLLTLKPEFRGKGIAKAVVASISLYAKDHHFSSLDLDYMSLAPWLKKYYEQFGFKETGEVIKWGTIDLIRMRKVLEG
jgi:predicted GNAT family N-acyltransferase